MEKILRTRNSIIEDVDVEFVATMQEECIKIKDRLDSINGVWITKGFTKRVLRFIAFQPIYDP